MAIHTILSNASANQTSAMVDCSSLNPVLVQAVVSGGTLTAGTLVSQGTLNGGKNYDTASHPLSWAYGDINSGKIIALTTGYPFVNFVIANLTFTYGKTAVAGVGTDDLTIAGTYTPLVAHSYVIKIAAANTAAVAATTTLTSTATKPVDGAIVTVGSQAYTFKTPLSSGPAVAFEVLIGASTSTALDNLKSAVNNGVANNGVGAGSTFGTGTTVNADLLATTKTATTLLFVADVAGTAGNALVSTTTGVNCSFPAVTWATPGTGAAAVNDQWYYSKDGAAFTAPTAMTSNGAAVNVADGITVAFAAVTGHTLGDYWTVTPAAISVYVSR